MIMPSKSLRYLSILMIVLALAFMMTSGVMAKPSSEVSTEEIKSLILEWEDFAQNVAAAPGEFRYKTTLAAEQRKSIATQRKAEIESKMERLWSSSSLQRKRIHDHWQTVADSIGGSDLLDLGGKVKSISVNSIKTSGNSTTVQVEMRMRWALLQVDPEKVLVVSEETVVQEYELVLENGKWMISRIEQISPGCNGEIVFVQKIKDDRITELPRELIEKASL